MPRKAKIKRKPKVSLARGKHYLGPGRYRRYGGYGRHPYFVTKYVDREQPPVQAPPSKMAELKSAIKETKETVQEAASTAKAVESTALSTIKTLGYIALTANNVINLGQAAYNAYRGPEATAQAQTTAFLEAEVGKAKAAVNVATKEMGKSGKYVEDKVFEAANYAADIAVNATDSFMPGPYSINNLRGTSEETYFDFPVPNQQVNPSPGLRHQILGGTLWLGTAALAYGAKKAVLKKFK